MNDRIRHLLDQMSVLEEDLRVAIHEQEASALYRIKGKRIEFEESIRQHLEYLNFIENSTARIAPTPTD